MFLKEVKSIPIIDYAERTGYTVVKKGKYYSLKEHDSVIINPIKNCFWRNSVYSTGSKGGAGSVIDFAIEFNSAANAEEAIKQIASLYGINGNHHYIKFKKPVLKEEPKRKIGDIDLPKRDNNMRNVYSYLLNTRCISKEVIDYFVRNNMLYQDVKKNCVFHTGKSFGCIRGTSTKNRFVCDLEGCDYNECFYFRGHSKASTLVVAESVIDIMSIMTQFVKEKRLFSDYSYLALSGTNKLNSVFYHVEKEQNSGNPIKYVMIATDNDKAGDNAALKITEGLKEFNIKPRRYAAPSGKDWNEYIVSINQKSKTQY